MAKLFLLSFLISIQTKALEYSHIQKLIDKNKIQSIGQLLPVLPLELRKNILVIFESHSLQEASCENPRIILFSNNGLLSLAFNGSPTQEGFESLEIQEFDLQSRSFLYQEKVFAEDLSLRKQVDSLRAKATATDRKLFRQGLNPSRCLSCHHADPRPNWEAYEHWPQTLGEGAVNHLKFIGPYGSFIGQKRNPQVAEACQKDFRSNFKKNSRYQNLEIEKLFLDPNKMNTLYTQLIFNLNFSRINRLIQSQPQRDLIKKIFLARMWDCKVEQALNLNFVPYALPTGDTMIADLLAADLNLIMKPFKFNLKQLYTSFDYGPTSQMTTPRSGTKELSRQLVEDESTLLPYFDLKTMNIGDDDRMTSYQALPKDRQKLCRFLNQEIVKSYPGRD